MQPFILSKTRDAAELNSQLITGSVLNLVESLFVHVILLGQQHMTLINCFFFTVGSIRTNIEFQGDKSPKIETSHIS